jgi:hypothetical protein
MKTIELLTRLTLEKGQVCIKQWIAEPFRIDLGG